MDAVRKATEADYFPYTSKRVCYIEQIKDEPLVFTNRVTDLREALERAFAEESIIYAVWPGEWASHLFLIDDLHALAEKIDYRGPVPADMKES